jgi:hypothetical protein
MVFLAQFSRRFSPNTWRVCPFAANRRARSAKDDQPPSTLQRRHPFVQNDDITGWYKQQFVGKEHKASKGNMLVSLPDHCFDKSVAKRTEIVGQPNVTCP